MRGVALPVLALAGYTNAGKSTLMNALTHANVGVSDKLFQTLDTTTRKFKRNSSTFLLTDTVGFIAKLPYNLIDAFKATLEETRVAGLIVHVADANVPAKKIGEKLTTVNAVLTEIGADTQPRLLVLNKADLLNADRRATLEATYAEAVLVSALNGTGLDELCARIDAALQSQTVLVDLLIPCQQAPILAQVYERGIDVRREDTTAGIRLRGRVPTEFTTRLQAFNNQHQP